jgi:hypothetical protein
MYTAPPKKLQKKGAGDLYHPIIQPYSLAIAMIIVRI